MEQQIQQVSDDTLVDLQEEYNKTDIQTIIDNLEADLVGLVPVKNRIRQIVRGIVDRKQKHLHFSMLLAIFNLLI